MATTNYFKRYFDSSLFDGLTINQSGAKNLGWCSFLCTKIDPKESEIALASSWQNWKQYGGAFIFSFKEPDLSTNEKVTAFLKLIASYLDAQYGSQSMAIVWLEDPTANTFTTANTTSMTLSVNAFDAVIVDSSLNDKITVDLTFTISGNSILTFNDDGENSSFLFKSSNTGKVKLVSSPIDNNSEVSPNQATLPFYNSNRGCFLFDIYFQQRHDFDVFDVGIKYFYPSGTDIESFTYPIAGSLDCSTFIGFNASIDPVDVLNDKIKNNSGFALRTYFSFTGKSIEDKDVNLVSNFRTNFGHVLSLAANQSKDSLGYPKVDQGILVFQSVKEDKTGHYYLVPSGKFSVITEIGNAKSNILVGLSGTETVSCSTVDDKNDIVCFHPGKSAYAPKFPLLPGQDDEDASSPKLEDKITTSWISFEKNGDNADNIYYSQPKGASLYAKAHGVGTQVPSLLGFYAPETDNLSEHDAIFPITPYAGLDLNTDSQLQGVTQFETQILGPYRKHIIHEASISKKEALLAMPLKTGLKSVDPIYSTSPQGLLVEVGTAQSSSQWAQLQLANNKVKEYEHGVAKERTYSLDFENLGAVLQSAFQTSEQFLVVSLDKGGNLGEFSNEMSIEGWPFLLNVPKEDTYGQYNNVLIFKFCKGTLQDLVKNTKHWTNPSSFNITDNGGLTSISSWLSSYVEKGVEQYTTNNDQDFYKFYQVATDPNWNGILALSTDISLEDFPEQLQGLLGGINTDKFRSHHFGIDVNHVTPDGDSNTLSMSPESSLFGLINYVDPLFEKSHEDLSVYRENVSLDSSKDYEFKVLLLKVLFENSKIKAFNSYIQIVLNKLFDEKVISENKDNLIIMKGTYEDHDGLPTYIFNSTGDADLSIDSLILNKVEIIKSDFSTLLPQGQDDATKVNARFSFWGFIDFHQLDGFDMFSFGNEQGENLNQKGLSFSNLYVDMSFALDTPSSKTFEFDISHISFNIGQSTTRDASLVPHFPLNLTGLISGDENDSPSKQNYLPVQLAQLNQQQQVSGKWYGLVFDLNMGTLGALAAKGGFTSSFIALWNVGATGASAGIRLPGVNTQSKFLSLQSVLKLDINTITLSGATIQKEENSAETDTPPDTGVYVMKINKIALKILSLTLPPGGDIDFYLFGDPDANADPSSLGWYAAYQKS